MQNVTGLQGNDSSDPAAMTIKPPKKTTYRHIPHSEKPPHLVARRNARERKRVQAVNSAFLKLRKHVPCENRQKRLSKVKTLQFAIDYIMNLQNMIEEHDSKMAGSSYNRPAEGYQGYSNDQNYDRYNYTWRDDEVHETNTNSNGHQQMTVWPEYGSLGMNEITSLPDA